MPFCKKCQTEKPEDAFAKRTAYCRSCTKAYRQANADQIRERNRVYQQAHRERTRAWVKACDARNWEARKLAKQQYYREHKEEILARNRVWKANHREQLREYSRKRTAQALGCELRDFTSAQWFELLHEFQHHCGYCGREVTLELDHRVPFSRGGTHTKANIIPACHQCNTAKGAMTEDEFRALIARHPTVIAHQTA